MKIKFFFVLIFTATINLVASNFHDHLFSIPFSKNFTKVAPSIFALPAKEMQLREFFKSEKDLVDFITYRWGKNAAVNFLNQNGYKQTLVDLCFLMPGDVTNNLERLLSLKSSTKVSSLQRQKEYIAIEDMRKKILLSLSADDFEEIYKDYFLTDPVNNRLYISAAVTRRFFDKKYDEKRVRLQQLALKENTHLVYRVSLQREELINNGVDFPERILNMLKDQSIGAIDMVGSLRESQYTYKDAAIIQDRFTELFDFVQKNKLVLVLHLFESCNNDLFYSALETSLNNVSSPMSIEIGHIAKLDQRWIDIFSSNPNLDVIFHVNVMSNMSLHGLTLETLRSTVNSLRQKGLKVVPGSDGRGIIPSSSYLEQKRLLDCPLDDLIVLAKKGFEVLN